ncbi:Protein N-acetyltransferase, RimJ/RimL family [Halobacillus dabanensis]|uniref:Protein N-acetyltransferase, RimJ/RimL family n=1 Tax=Halobacillus dabanensis TaxID=240302 RepID=A0A1I3TGE3_HALDA|nr:GNAT family N-acetyltransferase [Halobacillus dabanensis]SFJ70254.1 Protein N-acetyltransferase, RimJ/RimL family [Halobacillus dabanensis]
MPTIETDRLRMITFTADMMDASLRGELKKAAGYNVLPGYPMAAYREFFPYKMERFRQFPEENDYEGVIIHKGDQMIIGDMGFKGGPDDEGCMDIGYSMMEAYQGKGYTTEMAQAAVVWGLQQPGVQKITASCSETNLASVRVLEKAGFNRERTEDGEIYWSIEDIS